MISNDTNIVYFGKDPHCIKLLMDISDGSATIIDNNEDFQQKKYANKLDGTPLVFIDGEGVDDDTTLKLFSKIETELKGISKIYTHKKLDNNFLQTLVNKQSLHWYLEKPWDGRALIECIMACEDKIKKTRRPRLKPLTLIDPLTGLPNYTSLMSELEILIARSKKDNLPTSVIKINIDRLDEYNKAFGFQKADQMIRLLGIHLRRSLPKNFFVARPGAGDFVIIARGLNYQFAEKLAEKIRLESKNVPGFPLSLSLGIATFPSHGRSLGEIISVSNQALLSAKRRGKNQTVVAPHL